MAVGQVGGDLGFCSRSATQQAPSRARSPLVPVTPSRPRNWYCWPSGRREGDRPPSSFATDWAALAKTLEVGRPKPIPGNIPGRVGRGFEQPGPAGDVPAHCRALGL